MLEKKKVGEEKKKPTTSFQLFSPFVLALLCEGCTLRRTLIKISVPGAQFASDITLKASQSQIQIIGYLGQVM